MRQFKDFAPQHGNWGPEKKENKNRKKRQKRSRSSSSSSSSSNVKYYVSSDQLRSTNSNKTQTDRFSYRQQSNADPSILRLEQYTRPDSVTAELSPRPFCQYKTATTISELKQIRHSRRFLAIEGDQSVAGQRRLRQPAPIDSAAASASISSTTGRLLPDETPPPSTGGSAAERMQQQQQQQQQQKQYRAAPTALTLGERATAVKAKQNKNKLPPSSLSTAFLRLHAKEAKKTKGRTSRTTAKPRDDIRGALALPIIPPWKHMLTYPSGNQRKIATPLAFPTCALEREQFDQSLNEWEELSRKRIVAREQNIKHMSFLIANNRTYIERLEHARAYYRKAMRTFYIRRWYRHVRYLSAKIRINAWRLGMLRKWGYEPWKQYWNVCYQQRDEKVRQIQQWWKRTEQKRRYVRKIDFNCLVEQVVVAPPIPEKTISKWQQKLRGLMIASVVGLFIWGGEQFRECWFRERIRRALVQWKLYARKEVTIRRHLYFTSRASHGLMCAEIKRYASRARTRRRLYAVILIECSLRCYNARVLLTEMKEQKKRLMIICAKFGMASNDALLVVNFHGWVRVCKVERTMRNMFNRQSSGLITLVFNAWAKEGMNESRIEKVRCTIKIQSIYRGRAIRHQVEVMKRQLEFDRAAAERKKIREQIVARNGSDEQDTTNLKKIEKGYFSDSSSSDEGCEEEGDGEAVNLIIIEEFGQDMSTLKNVVARYTLIVNEIERMTSTLSRFEEMYKQAREYVMELGYEMKDVRKCLHDLRQDLEQHRSVIRSIERQRLAITKIRSLTDDDMQRDLKLSKRLKRFRQEEDHMLRNIHTVEDKERKLQGQYVDEHRAMSDEKQNSAVYFDTSALSWNRNDADEKKGTSASGPTTQRFPMRTTKQRAFLEAALRQGQMDVKEEIRVERKRLKLESKTLRRNQRALERECLEQLLWLSIGNEEDEANRQSAHTASVGGGKGGGKRSSSSSSSSSNTFKFTRMLSDPDPKKTEPKVRSVCLEWRSMLDNGWLPPTKIAGWIAGGLLEPSIPLRSRVVAFRCVREVMGDNDQVMAEIAFAISKGSMSGTRSCDRE